MTFSRVNVFLVSKLWKKYFLQKKWPKFWKVSIFFFFLKNLIQNKFQQHKFGKHFECNCFRENYCSISITSHSGIGKPGQLPTKMTNLGVFVFFFLFYKINWETFSRMSEIVRDFPPNLWLLKGINF